LVAAVGDRETLRLARDTAASSPELASLVPAFEGLLEAEALTSRILVFVGEHPATIQKDLAAALGEDKQAVSYACWMAALVGRLERTKRGVSYELRTANPA
jgi:hypothetical protein